MMHSLPQSFTIKVMSSLLKCFIILFSLNIGSTCAQQTGLTIAMFGGTTFTSAYGNAKPDQFNDGIKESKYLKPALGYTFGATLQYDLTNKIAVRGSYSLDQKVVKTTGDAYNQFGEKIGTYVLYYKHGFNSANMAVQYSFYRNRLNAYCTFGFFTSFPPIDGDRFFESELYVNGGENTLGGSYRTFTMHGGIMSGGGFSYFLGKHLGLNVELMTYTAISNYNYAGNGKKFNLPFGAHGTLGLSYFIFTHDSQ